MSGVLVLVGPVCPDCGEPAAVMTVTQPPLPGFRHGGYGAATATTLHWCGPCRWSTVAEVAEVNPRLKAV